MRATCGATKPIKPITPTKLIAVAVIIATRTKTLIRNTCKLIPRLAARSSPKRSAVNFQSSLETTAYLKDLGAKLVVSRAARDVQARFLLRNGADEVVYPEKQLANWTAIRYSSEHIFDYIQLSDDHAIFEISIPENWVGKTVGNIDIRKKYNITIMALKRDGKLEMSITPDTVLDKDVTMLVLGASRDIQKCFHI